MNHIELLDAAGKAFVNMDCQGFPYFGIWSKKVDEFICLEPWYSIADVAAVTEILKTRQECRGLQLGTAGSMRIRLPSKNIQLLSVA